MVGNTGPQNERHDSHEMGYWRRSRHVNAAEFEALCEEFQISPELRPGFEAQFHNTADIVVDQRDYLAQLGSRRTNSKSLSKITKLTAQIEDCIEQLPAELRSSVFSNFDCQNSATAEGEIKHTDPLNRDEAFYRGRHEGFTRTKPPKPELIRILQALGAGISDTHHALGPPTRGPKAENGLQVLLLNLKLTWTRHLGRNFTRDATNDGQPISEAACFCVRACQIIAPEIPSSRVLNEMKKIAPITKNWRAGRDSKEKR